MDCDGLKLLRTMFRGDVEADDVILSLIGLCNS